MSVISESSTRWKFAPLWDTALSFEQFLAESTNQPDLWSGVYKTARIPDEIVAEASQRAARLRLLAIVEDWCGDAANSVPVIARLAELIAGWELRVVRRDEHLELMDAYLTEGARSIPIVIALSEDMHEIGHWGPRPAELQEWVMAQRAAGAGKEIYPETRRRYAVDKGRSVLRELVEVVGGAG